ncbi:AraC family transcriptional regulator [Marinilabiliaceae bacterium JC017]|nr:AraC family transcriptional regulator [Marinilabiliaceae bacterium JC017]
MNDFIITFATMQTIITLGVVQAFFAALALLTKRPVRLPDKLLSGWLFATGGWFTIKLIQQQYSGIHMNMGGGNLLLAVGPFMYLYSYYLINGINRFRVKNLVHFVPAILFMILSATVVDNTQKVIPRYFFTRDSNLWFRILYSVCFNASIIGYTFCCFRLLHRHESTIENFFSSHSEKYNLRWIKYIFSFFTILFLLIIFIAITNLSSRLGLKNLIRDIMNIGFLAFTYSVSLFGFRQGFVYEGKLVHLLNQSKAEEPASVATPKYEKSGLKSDEADQHLQSITSYMEKHYLWRNSDLTIQHLSDQLNIPKHHITQTINSKLGKNFYQFVNEYRLAEVKKMLVDLNYASWSILGIAYECGFNSKSSFNTFFKQATGQTPSEYKKNSQSVSE